MLFTNATIKTMVSDTIENGFLEVKNGKIHAFGSMEKAPKTKDTIDLKGKMILPGFIDAHTHIGMYEEGVGHEGEDINEMSDPCTPQIRALDAIDPLDRCFDDARKAGVTTIIVSPGSANPIAGQIVALKSINTNSVDKMILKQPFAMKFAMGENPKRVYGGQDEAPFSRMATASIIRENLAKAKRYIEDKERAIAEEESLPDLDYKLEALALVLNGEIKAHFHSHRAYDTLTAIRIAEEFGIDYTIIHCTEGHRIADVLAEKNVKAVIGPLLGTRSKPELSNATMDNCATMINAGMEVAISTDHPEVPVSLLALSASLVMKDLLTEDQALKTLTYWAAKAVGLEQQVGSIAKGLDADLLIFAENPLQVNVQPEMVFINGEQIV